MTSHLPLLLLLLSTSLHDVITYEVALFPSSGCYSHDVMMKQIGEEFEEQDDHITWIQTFLYDFGFGEMELDKKWTRIREYGHDQAGLDLMREAGELIWEMNVPRDFDQPLEHRGSISFFTMLARHQQFCEKMMVNQDFLNLVKNNTIDVIIIDHFLTECLGGLAHLLNASTVQFSNWPIADGYITSFNVPANPSATPKTGTPFGGLGMSFMERVVNTLFHLEIIVARVIQTFILDRLFIDSGYPQVNIIQTEASRVIYAGRSEFLYDVVRPINNRIKHFGGANCREPSEYVTSLPVNLHSEPEVETMPNFIGILPNSTIIDPLCNSSCTLTGRKTKSYWTHRKQMYMTVSSLEASRRHQKLMTSFPDIDWQKIEEEPFVLVSFGSIARVSFAPPEVLKILLDAFNGHRQVIWQTNTKKQVVLEILENFNLSLPHNVMVTQWAPVKELMVHPNLQYMICHGGINTLNELLRFGVPVLGVPLQGDQGSNLRRLKDLGAAEIVKMVELRKGKLAPVMRKMEQNLDSYWERSTKLASMLKFYRSLHGGNQKFWLKWTARNGPRIANRNLLKFKYTGDEENRFYFTLATLIGLALITVSY